MIKQFFKSITFWEAAFLFFSLILGFGFMYLDGNSNPNHVVWFARLGIPLQFLSSKSSNLQSEVRLYITEIYLLLLFVGTLFTRKYWPPLFLNAPKNKKLFLLVLIFLVVALLRLLPDLRVAPIWSVRNAAFAWYHLIPLCIFLMPIRPKVMEFYFYIILLLAFIYFYFSVVLAIFGVEPTVYWIPFVGVYAPFFLALFVDKIWVSFLLMFPISFSFAMGYLQNFQRTNLLGLVILLIAIVFMRKIHPIKFFKRAFLFLLIALISVAVLKHKPNVSKGFWSVSPLLKGATGPSGLETFRSQMWGDAWELFTNNPVAGIGFNKQVVYRVYLGAGVYVPNDWASFDKLNKAPVSGPHNSYLNALARMGLGSVFLFALQIYALIILWRKRVYAGLFILYAGMVYAFFNIGLEGPVRSFLLLLAIALAMKCENSSDDISIGVFQSRSS